MKQPEPETKGKKLHRELIECLSDNPKGMPYAQCSRLCEVAEYWVLDSTGNECFSAKKTKTAFCVKSMNTKGEAKNSWLVCVDEGLIKSQKSNSMARCDNLLFDDERFFFVEAKMNVKSDKWRREFGDAIEHKIPKTKSVLDSALSAHGFAITQVLGIAIPFPGANSRVPRNNSQKAESLREDARKWNKWVKDLILEEVIVLDSP